MLHVAECRENGDIYKEVEPGGGETCRGPSLYPLEERKEGKGKKQNSAFVCWRHSSQREKAFELPEPKRFEFSGPTVDF